MKKQMSGLFRAQHIYSKGVNLFHLQRKGIWRWAVLLMLLIKLMCFCLTDTWQLIVFLLVLFCACKTASELKLLTFHPCTIAWSAYKCTKVCHWTICFLSYWQMLDCWVISENPQMLSTFIHRREIRRLERAWQLGIFSCQYFIYLFYGSGISAILRTSSALLSHEFMFFLLQSRSGWVILCLLFLAQTVKNNEIK